MKRILVLLTAFLISAPAWADAPALIPVQGYLADASDQPVNDVFAVTFTLYTDSQGTSSVWSEEAPVNFVDGYFTSYLGSSVTLDLAAFRDNSSLYLGITVSDDAEMPLMEIGTAPYAGFAQYAGSAADLTDDAKLSLISDVAIQLENDSKVHDRYTDAEAAAAALEAVDSRKKHWYGTWNNVNDGSDATTALPFAITIEKARADSDLKLTFSANLRTNGAAGSCCRWAIRVDDQQCSSAPINGSVYINPAGNYHQHRTITGICSDVPAGQHNIQVWVEQCEGYPVHDCYTGWNSQSYLIAEEM